jgi:hypothetical protein
MPLLNKAFDLAESVLAPAYYPYQKTNPIPKYVALEAAAEGNPGTVYPAHVNVSYTDRVNGQGVFQPGCKLCGDCNSGCNYGSKNVRPPRPLSLVPRPSSLVPRPSSLIPHPSSLIPHPSPLFPRPSSSLIPRPSSLVPRPSSLIPRSSSHFPIFLHFFYFFRRF